MGHFTEQDMEDQDQTPSRLIEELAELRRRMAEWETTIEQEKKGEEALREREERFRGLFETLTLGVVYQDRGGEISRANPAAERILGMTLDQMRGRTALDPRWRAIHEDGTDFPGETHPFTQALATGGEVKNVIMGVYHPAQEEYVWVNIQAVPQFRPGEDRPFQVLTTLEDITEKKQAQDEIKLLARFPNENPNPVLRVRGDGILMYGNQASSRLLRHWEIAVGKQVPEEIQTRVAEALGSGTVLRWDIQVQDRHFALTMAPVAEQKAVNIYGLDITEQKKVEENLIREKEKFQILVDASPLGVSLMGSDGRYKYLNPKFTAIFGYTLEDVPAGRDWFRKAYPDEAYRREVIAQWLKDLQEFPHGEVRPRTFKVDL